MFNNYPIVYLRELPEPLFTNEKENEFAEALMDTKDEEERIEKYRELLKTIPDLNARSSTFNKLHVLVLVLVLTRVHCALFSTLRFLVIFYHSS